MGKILEINKAIELAQKLRKQNKSIVLAGGCFDILHIGHIEFLEKAKKQADILFILLESDQNIKKYKGEKRPINHQKDRAKLLAAISSVDYIVNLKSAMDNQKYDNLVIAIKPAIIAATEGDPNVLHKKRQANLIKAKFIYVNKKINNRSTTRLVKLLEKDL